MVMRHRLLTLLCGLGLLMPLTAGADAGDSSDTPWNQQTDAKQITADYDAGYRHLKTGEYKSAIKAFKRVLRVNPEHAMAYTNMAYSYRKLGKYKKAIKLYTQALTLAPNLPEAHEYMGEALLALGRVQEAKRHLAILEKLDPEMAKELRTEIRRHEQS